MFEELEELVVQWAKSKGILDSATPMTQFTKTAEETNELLVALVNDKKHDTVDALGDILVTLIIQAEMQGVSMTYCLQEAYDVISKRTGKMVDGVFVKDE